MDRSDVELVEGGRRERDKHRHSHRDRDRDRERYRDDEKDVRYVRYTRN